MAAEISSVRERKPSGFMTLLSSAVCEWFLMFLLFADAALSYLLTKFAQYCELKTPCMLCSRLDNGFGKKNPGCYWSLLCSNHREEISSLVSCSIHGKFADVHGMCEECLMPIAMQNKSNSESYRLLVGKSWMDIDRSVYQNLMLNKHVRVDSGDHRTCSCCSKAWTKSNAERLPEVNRVGFTASRANLKPPLPRAPGRSRFNRRDSLKRLRDKFTGPMAHHPVGSSPADTLSHVGYTKLKISSDSESEVPISEDDDDGNASSHSRNSCRSEKSVKRDRIGLHKPLANNAASEKKTHQGFDVKPSILDQAKLLDLRVQKNGNSSSSDALILHGRGDFNREDSHNKPIASSTPELISLDDGPQPPVVAGDSLAVLAETSKSNVSPPHMPALSVLSELLSLCNASSLSNAVTIPKKINIGATSGEGDTSVAKHIEAVEGTSADDARSLESNSIKRTDALNDEAKELSDRHAFEPTNTSDSAKTEEDTKSLSKISTSEVSLLSKDTTPRAQDKSSFQVLPVSALLRKNSSYDSLDGITVSEIEGESIVDRLKRQVEHDRNCLTSLYKELEEERNAAADAVNQAMAMITRLQEEKAALHMEALQYLRMMEEQAEYDMEALERANDLLAEKEKEFQDLEIELEFYKNNSLDESGVQNLQKENSVVDNRVAARTETGPSISSNSKAAKISKANGNCKPLSSSVSNFEDEKLYISQCLKKLEKKLHQAQFDGKLDCMPNGINYEKTEVEVGDHEALPPNSGISVLNGNPALDTGSNGTPAKAMENNCLYEKSDKFSDRGETNYATLEKEIVELHDRLEALETDQNFLKHTSDLLRNGKDGLQIVQEIAHQLEELRKLEFKKRRLSVL